MDYPCYRCGHLVGDGKPFCAGCGAPQIRVTMPDAATAVPTASSFDGSAFTDSPVASAGFNAPPITSIEWPVALRVCSVVSLIAALIMTSGLVVPLLAVLSCGFLAVTLYHRRQSAWLVNARSGAQLGAVCGAIFFATATVLQTAVVVLLHAGGQVREKIMEALQQAAARSGDPQVQIALDRLKAPEGLALMVILGMILLFVVSVAGGGFAGALTGAFLGRRKRF